MYFKISKEVMAVKKESEKHCRNLIEIVLNLTIEFWNNLLHMMLSFHIRGIFLLFVVIIFFIVVFSFMNSQDSIKVFLTTS